MTWQPGRDRVNRLLNAGELDVVTPDETVARRLISNASKHLDTATSAVHADVRRRLPTRVRRAAQVRRCSPRRPGVASDQSRRAHRGPRIRRRPVRRFRTGIQVLRPDPTCTQRLRVPRLQHPRPHGQRRTGRDIRCHARKGCGYDHPRPGATGPLDDLGRPALRAKVRTSPTASVVSHLVPGALPARVTTRQRSPSLGPPARRAQRCVGGQVVVQMGQGGGPRDQEDVGRLVQ